MRVAVVGSGYVGLTAGICLAESGNNVIGVDVDQGRIEKLNQGILPICERGLGELLRHNLQNHRIVFTTDLAQAVRNSLVIFIAVGTPPLPSGQVDMRQMEKAARAIIRILPAYRVLVVKSTVPVGTSARLSRELARLTDKPFDLVSNPEFLKEGCAVEDFLRPDRVVIGTTSPKAASALEELYEPFVRNGRPIILMDPTSAEMTKYAANAMLSAKISFINEIANLCDLFGADINSVRRGICSDSRIGYQFLHPGLGFGGSSFPKDVQALIHAAERAGYPGWLLKAVRQVNEYQKQTLQRKILRFFGEDLSELKFAVWGVAFKPRTDDIRESPAVGLIGDLLVRSAQVCAHDPQALANLRKIFGDRLHYCADMYEALDGADALCLATEWTVYRNPNPDRMLQLMRQPVIFDGRNVYDADKLRSKGFTYFAVGRGGSPPPATRPEAPILGVPRPPQSKLAGAAGQRG